jgi:hypothetical protein
MSIFAISDKLSLESTGGISLPESAQADSLTKNTKTKLTVLSKGDTVIIPIPSVDKGPADERNIKGVVMNVNVCQ